MRRHLRHSLLALLACLLAGKAFAEPATFSCKTYAYKTVGKTGIEADVHRADDDRKRPVVVWIHGGALIVGSLEAGAILAGASAAERRALSAYGRAIGLSFQIADDILDIVGDKKLLGKNGSDRENGKLTFPAVYGLDESRRRGKQAVARAKAALKPFGKKAVVLEELADYIIERKK